jgi:hypothetical protein
MHKIALGIAAVATLAASPLFQNRAEATTLGTSAGLRVAIDANQPVEDVTYYGYRRGYRYGYRPYYRHYGYRHYGYRPYYRHYGYRHYGYRPYYRSYSYGY